jgi:phosphoribosylamine--glycine ligase
VKLLVVGSGGREHALLWRLGIDPKVTEMIGAPGNPGMAKHGRLAHVQAADIEGLLAIARDERVDFTVVGPELPLSLGIVDAFEAAGLLVVGPTQAAARLETSKAFAKAFMARHGVPTADYVVCDDEESARKAIASGRFAFPLVVKADGLAAGKGVVVAADRAEAEAAIAGMMRERRFGDAGSRVLIEQCLSGPEVSYFALCDGRRALSLGSAQDHKRVNDNDTGPNTGGMGAFGPSPLCTPELEARINKEIVEPVLEGMRAEGHPYRGILYCGLMLTESGPRVIEFNVRFGDPEAQVILPIIEGDLVTAFRSAAEGDLGTSRLQFGDDRAVAVVVASGGYPGRFEAGKPIDGIEDAESLPGVFVFHAGTAERNGQLVTAGGRVLTVVGRANEFEMAIVRAYEALNFIEFEGMHARTDIGKKAITT